MKDNPKLIAIKIMADGKKADSYDDEKAGAHKAVCPKCGHEWMMGEESDDDSDEYDDED